MSEMQPVRVTSGRPTLFAPIPDEDVWPIRNALSLRWFAHAEGSRSLAIVSRDPADGRSGFAANLASSFAEAAFSVLLIDGDLHIPSQHDLFGIEREPGLSNFLGAPDNPIPWQHVSPYLTVLTGGSPTSDARGLLLSEALEALFHRARNEFQVVIADTPAARSGAECQLIAAQAIGAVILLREGFTRTAEAQALVNECRSFGVRVLGSVTIGKN